MTVKSQLEELVAYLAPLAQGNGSPAAPAIPRETWTGLADNLDYAVKTLGEAIDHLDEAAREPLPVLPGPPLETAEELEKRRRRHGARSKALRTRADSVRDVRYEAEDLTRRARVHARRARPAPSLTLVEEAQLEKALQESKAAGADAKRSRAIADIATAVARATDRRDAEAYVGRLLAMVEEARTGVHDGPDSEQPAGAPATPAEERVEAALSELAEEIKRQLKELTGRSTRSPSAKSAAELAADELRSAQGTLETARSKLDGAGKLDGPTQSFYEELDLLTELILGSRRLLQQVPRG